MNRVMSIWISTVLLLTVASNLFASSSFLVEKNHRSIALDLQWRTIDDLTGFGFKGSFYTKRNFGLGFTYVPLKGDGDVDGAMLGLHITKDKLSSIQSYSVNFAFKLATEFSATDTPDQQYVRKYIYTLSNLIVVDMSVVPDSQRKFRLSPSIGITLAHEQQRIDGFGQKELEYSKDFDAFVNFGLQMCYGSSNGSMILLEPYFSAGDGDTRVSITLGYLFAFTKRQEKRPYTKPSRWKTD